MSASSWVNLFQWFSLTSGILAVVSIIGLWISTSTLEREKNDKISTLEKSTVALRDYSDVAALNLIGKPQVEVDGDLVLETPISQLLKGTYDIQGTTVTFHVDATAEAKFREVITAFPRFPFAYYALAGVLQRRDDPEWKVYAEKAVQILQYTSMISTADPNHRQKLLELENALRVWASWGGDVLITQIEQPYRKPPA